MIFFGTESYYVTLSWNLLFVKDWCCIYVYTNVSASQALGLWACVMMLKYDPITIMRHYTNGEPLTIVLKSLNFLHFMNLYISTIR